MTIQGNKSEDASSFKELLCYHCGTKKHALVYCELWMVTACKNCIKTHHDSHHKSCKREVQKNNVTEGISRPFFRLTLTRFDGSKVGLLMRLGDVLEMEEHWAGTYILSPQMLLLVTEDIATINRSILTGLRSVTRDAGLKR